MHKGATNLPSHEGDEWELRNTAAGILMNVKRIENRWPFHQDLHGQRPALALTGSST
jgi:hypothetical protein